MGILPESYPDDTITLMPVELGKAYVYWDIAYYPPGGCTGSGGKSDESMNIPSPEKEFVVKIFQIFNSGASEERILWKEYPANSQCRCLFLDLDWQEKRYQAELGSLNRRGDFHSIAGSNSIGRLVQSKSGENSVMKHIPCIPCDFAEVQPQKREGRLGRREMSRITAECELKFRTGVSSTISSKLETL
jgi:hypothetical protein